MSIATLNIALEATGMKPMAKLVFICLSNYMDEDGVCWPSIKTISRQTGMSKSTTMNHVNSLVESGYLFRHNRIGPTGTQSNIYQLNWDKMSHTPIPGFGIPHTEIRYTPYRDSVTNRSGEPTNNNNKGEQPKSTKFKAPTVEEIQAYLDDKGYTEIDAEYFHAYYETRGWMMGKTKMKSWKAAITTWRKNNAARNVASQSKQDKYDRARSYTTELLKAQYGPGDN